MIIDMESDSEDIEIDERSDSDFTGSDSDVIEVADPDGNRIRRNSENTREQVVVEDAENGDDLGSMDMFALSWRSQITPAGVCDLL